MFDIEYKGANAIVVSTKKTTLFIDPRLSLVGLKDLKVKDEVVLATEPRFAVPDGEARITIDGPGEYEIADFSVKGIPAVRHIDADDAEKASTIYTIECGDVKMAVIGNVAPKLSEDQLEAIGVVNMLVLPVGGAGYTLDATSAVSVIRQVEPKVVIPVHYADGALKYEVSQDVLDTFVQELAAPIETTGKYKIKSSSSFPAVLTVVELTRS